MITTEELATVLDTYPAFGASNYNLQAFTDYLNNGYGLYTARDILTMSGQFRSTPYRIARMNEDTFEALRAGLERIPTYTILTSEGEVTGYAYSPDGEGVVWYDTLNEMMTDTGH